MLGTDIYIYTYIYANVNPNLVRSHTRWLPPTITGRSFFIYGAQTHLTGLMFQESAVLFTMLIIRDSSSEDGQAYWASLQLDVQISAESFRQL